MQANDTLAPIIEQGVGKGFLVRVILLCGLVAMVDGFDTQSIGLVAPDIAAEWRVPGSAFGMVFGAGLFGGLIGALIFGAVADKVGRKPSLLFAVLMMAAASLVTPFTTNLGELSAVRFVIGIGLGGALPGTVALTSEYAPARLRATLVGLMFCGFPLGAVVGSIISSQLLPHFGWRSIFYLGSIAPLLLFPAVLLFVPESARFLRERNPARFAKLIAKFGLNGDSFAPAESGVTDKLQHIDAARVGALFAPDLVGSTLRIWATLFCCLLLAYFLVNWIPMIARNAGVGVTWSVLSIAALNLGGIIGCLALGRIVDGTGSTKIVSISFICGAAAVAGLGVVHGSAVMLILLAFLAGGFCLGAQMTAVALTPIFYRTALRATGVGWSMAAGRVGAIVGPIVGGLLLARGLGAPALFLIAGSVSLLAALAISGLRPRAHEERRETIRPVRDPSALLGDTK
jgi:AAHS family 4-hydroxybenzoate transporter-like MFS transporter